MADYEEFVNTRKKPDLKKHVIAKFKVKVPMWSSKKRAYGAVAAESSVGTWSKIDRTKYKYVNDVAAWVYKIEGNYIYIAYPEDHFEYGNMPQILASIAGNVFGMKAVSSLRLEDISFTDKHIKAFKGPKYGRKGIRHFMKVKDRPIMLSVAKPKVGMTTEEHTKMGEAIWRGGLDLLKDDENLTSQFFNPFRKRVDSCLKVRDKIEKETGDRKSYLINITAPTVKEMEKRAKYIAKNGGEFAMVDIMTLGWAGVASMRDICSDLNLAMHAHRAMHGAMTRNHNQGISMQLVAKISRMIGTDILHIGTANVGKLVGTKSEVLQIYNQTTAQKVEENKKEHTLEQDWGKIRSQFPCSSGGLHPLIVDQVMDKMGSDIMLQIGGGIHGHPKGSYAGAKAMVEAVDAYMHGESLDDKAKHSKELAQALAFWGHKRTR